MVAEEVGGLGETQPGTCSKKFWPSYMNNLYWCQKKSGFLGSKGNGSLKNH